MKRDLIDLKILHELDMNARIPVTQLARKLRQSREKINYRIGRLLEEKVIRKFVCVINPAKLGYDIYKLYFKFQNMSKEKEREAIGWLVRNAYVYWLATCQGPWDLNITIFARNISHFEEVMSEFTSRYGQYIQNQEFNTTLSVGVSSKDWLLEQKHVSKICWIGGDTQDINIGKLDVELLRLLANNARMNSAELARKLKTTQRIVIYRMKQLEEQGIILGYTTSLDLETLKMQFFKTTVLFNVMTEKLKKKITEWCRQTPEIGFFIFCVGSWPLELEIIVKDNRQLYDVMDKFKEQFPEMRGYETVIFPKEYKFDWMPLCYEAQK